MQINNSGANNNPAGGAAAGAVRVPAAPRVVSDGGNGSTGGGGYSPEFNRVMDRARENSNIPTSGNLTDTVGFLIPMNPMSAVYGAYVSGGEAVNSAYTAIRNFFTRK